MSHTVCDIHKHSSKQFRTMFDSGNFYNLNKFGDKITILNEFFVIHILHIDNFLLNPDITFFFVTEIALTLNLSAQVFFS